MSDYLGGAIPSGDGNTWMPDVWGYLLVKYDIGSLIDIGCGFGHCLVWWSQFQVSGVGVEGWEEAVKGNVYKGGPIVQHDFAKGSYVHGTPFDLGWCAEVLEHIDQEFLPNLAPSFQACRYVCITHGEPHQGGFHHVNCQPDSYWLNIFSGWGFMHLESETKLLRRTDRWHAPWGRRSLMFFERR